MLTKDSAFLVVVDVQEKLARAMHDKDSLIQSTVKMVQGAKILGLPILWTEQNPNGLGPTVPEVKELLTDLGPVTKLSFSCYGEERFKEKIDGLNRKQALVLGIESHVCVYQTVVDLIRHGYEVQVIADAVSSRTAANAAIGLDRCRLAGASITSTETALFEILQKAEGDQFKQMLKVVK